MKEDLISVALGVACLITRSNRELGKLAEWTINEIFEDDKIQSIHNVVIRHAGRLIVERAFLCDFVKEEQVIKSRPPYKIEKKLLKLDEEAAKSQSETFTPHYMDLSWDVIKESYKGFFETRRKLDTRSCLQNDEWENLSTESINKFLEGTFGEIEFSVKNSMVKILENREREKKDRTRIVRDIKNELTNCIEGKNSQKEIILNWIQMQQSCSMNMLQVLVWKV
ncbi:MAG: hypothetical protein NHB15_17620 [Methanosarcina barkeri]|nr:hypothetical protein [Methanosarcina sp. ERenArc_MAG2]